MIDLTSLDEYRVRGPAVIEHFGSEGDSTCGCFMFRSKSGGVLRVIASSGEGWDHVSVSLENRCPTWEEMDAVKRVFFKPDEVAMQLHVAQKDHINCHPFTLHLWRSHDKETPLPPKILVGPT